MWQYRWTWRHYSPGTDSQIFNAHYTLDLEHSADTASLIVKTIRITLHPYISRGLTAPLGMIKNSMIQGPTTHLIPLLSLFKTHSFPNILSCWLCISELGVDWLRLWITALNSEFYCQGKLWEAVSKKAWLSSMTCTLKVDCIPLSSRTIYESIIHKFVQTLLKSIYISCQYHLLG